MSSASVVLSQGVQSFTLRYHIDTCATEGEGGLSKKRTFAYKGGGGVKISENSA